MSVTRHYQGIINGIGSRESIIIKGQVSEFIGVEI